MAVIAVVVIVIVIVVRVGRDGHGSPIRRLRQQPSCYLITP
jgi:hypothetical protein